MSGLDTQYVHSEVQVQSPEIRVRPTEKYAKVASADDLVGIAEQLWKESKKLKKLETDPSIIKAKLHEINPDFAVSFPLVVQWMIEPGQFSSKVFRQYLVKYAKEIKSSSTDRKAYWNLQVEYPVGMFKAQHPKRPKTAYESYRKDLVESLEKEDKAFSDILAEVVAEQEAADRESLERTRNRIKERFLERLSSTREPTTAG